MGEGRRKEKPTWLGWAAFRSSQLIPHVVLVIQMDQSAVFHNNDTSAIPEIDDIGDAIDIGSGLVAMEDGVFVISEFFGISLLWDGSHEGTDECESGEAAFEEFFQNL